MLTRTYTLLCQQKQTSIAKRATNAHKTSFLNERYPRKKLLCLRLSSQRLGSLSLMCRKSVHTKTNETELDAQLLFYQWNSPILSQNSKTMEKSFLLWYPRCKINSFRTAVCFCCMCLAEETNTSMLIFKIYGLYWLGFFLYYVAIFLDFLRFISRGIPSPLVCLASVYFAYDYLTHPDWFHLCLVRPAYCLPIVSSAYQLPLCSLVSLASLHLVLKLTLCNPVKLG